MRPIVLVAAKQSYRVGDFIDAASLLRMEPVVASDADTFFDQSGRHVSIDLDDPVASATHIAATMPEAIGVLAVDDQGVVIAALAAAKLGVPHNSHEAAAATRDKHLMRSLLMEGEVRQPRFLAAGPGEVSKRAADIGYPAVVKPVGLSASRGVIRVDGPAAAQRAEIRVREILAAAGRGANEPLLVEEYIPGVEVAVEGLLVEGDLEVLAFIDKPEPLEGPYFEETLYVTPSRLPAVILERVERLAGDAVGALGLSVGPVHTEIRIPSDGNPVLIEVAARTIGGLCGRALSFGLVSESLEVLAVRAAAGMPSPMTDAAKPASGVLMLPIPATGLLTEIVGLEEARSVRGVDNIEITIPIGRSVVALPEGDRYLGFVFASAADAAQVEEILRRAGAALTVVIDGEDVRPPISASSPLPG